MLLTGVGMGVLLSSSHARPWVLVVTEVVFASAGSLVADRLGLRPAGPFFGIFALGTTGAVPATRVSPWVALSICAATVLLCLLVSFASASRSRTREQIIRRPRRGRVRESPGQSGPSWGWPAS
nr:hypothetical protein [Saccharopolyspora pogona]